MPKTSLQRLGGAYREAEKGETTMGDGDIWSESELGSISFRRNEEQGFTVV